MTKSEQATMAAMSKSLRNSIKTDWSSGDLNDWAEYAKKMKARIYMATDVINELCKLTAEDDTPINNDIKLD